jgi:hypothetical protein
LERTERNWETKSSDHGQTIINSARIQCRTVFSTIEEIRSETACAPTMILGIQYSGYTTPIEAVLRPVNCSPITELPVVLSYTNDLFTLPFMSHTQPTASSSSNQSSNFQLIINNALDAYKKRTKNDLLAHPLVTELQYCNSPSTILAVLQQQLQGLDQFQTSDERWTRWLDPTVNVLYTLSGTLGEGVGLVCLRT